jgi:hypothetical protein
VQGASLQAEAGKAATVLRSSADRSHVVFAFVVILSMILIQKRYARAGA